MQLDSDRIAAIISAFESMTRRYPHQTCFTFVDAEGGETAYSYREVRMYSAALAHYLRERGVERGSYVAVDLPNCPLFVLLVIAAAYGDFCIVALNNRLTASEKLGQLLELGRLSRMSVAFRIDESNKDVITERMAATLSGQDQRGTVTRSGQLDYQVRAAAAHAKPRSARAMARTRTGREARRRQDELDRQDAVESVIHFAERSARSFSAGARALVMFTSGSTGKPKAVPLTWDNLCESANASNERLNRPGEGLWQASLPLYHVGGFQVVVRSLLNGTPFVLYSRFDAKRLLADAARRHATHVPVVDKMLQDMLDVAERAGEHSLEMAALRGYEVVLLGGAALNPKTIERAVGNKVRVYASYGMTETSSQIANAPVTPSFDGGLKLLPGYSVRVVDPDPEGFGKLAVRGPGVLEGYLNANTPHTVDGFFLTGDEAAFVAGKLYLRERTQDMFVSGGENVYPAQIRNALLQLPEVNDAYVFGMPDKKWGRRPIAFVECAQGQVPSANDVLKRLAPLLSKLYLPREVYPVSYLPRTGIGKIDRQAIESRYEQRIDVESVTLHRIRVPFKRPFRTAKETLTHRESILIEVRDQQGRIGVGECVAFDTDWYLPEVLDDDERVLREVLAPAVIREVYLHPSEVAMSFASKSGAVRFPMARSALEMALWDLYGKIAEKPLWKLIGGRIDGAARVPAGAVVGIGTPSETIAAVERCLGSGYKRVKLKVAPGPSVEAARAVRERFPNAVLTFDANQSFTEDDMDQLRVLDECQAMWIEEPLDPARPAANGPRDIFARLSRLQRSISTTICLDESIVRPGDAARALRYGELRCFALKIAKLGGIQPALEFTAAALQSGRKVWVGGMYDTGVSKRVHAAFETLVGLGVAGDIGSVSRYFPVDVTNPPYEVSSGMILINDADHPHGIGCELDHEALQGVLVRSVTIR